MKYSIIICCYEEEPIIEASWNRLKDVLPEDCEVIFVNDGSTDKTGEILYKIAETENINIINYSENKGYGHALKCGLSSVLGDYIITLDCDLAMEPKDIFEKCKQNESDLIIFSRYAGIKPDYPLIRRIASWGYRKMNQFLFKIKIEDTQSGFLCIKREVLKDIKLECDDFSILMELIVKATRKNIRWQEVGLKFIHDTTSGQTSIFKSGPKMLKNSIRLWKALKQFHIKR